MTVEEIADGITRAQEELKSLNEDLDRVERMIMEYVNSDIRTADNIERMVEEMDTRGWCQGTEVNDAGQVCLIGAMQVAGLNDWVDMRAVINAIGHTSILSVTAWNDDARRTYDQVRDKLMNTAKDLRNKA